MARSPSRPEPRRNASPARSRLGQQLEQHQGTAVDSLLRLLAEPLGSMLTWTVIGIALALPLTLYLLLQNVQGMGRQLDAISTLSVYLEKGVSNPDLETLVLQLQNRPDVATATAVTPDQALAEFTANSGFGNVLAGLEANPLPAVIVVTPVSLDPGALSTLQSQLQALPGVSDVAVDLAWLQRLQAIVGLAKRLAMLLGLMLALGVLLVIGNTIRLAIENRRAEIVVVKLVGGTDSYVARPFLYTGLWYGVGGGLVAILLASVSIWLLSAPYTRLLGSYDAAQSLAGLGISGAFLVLVLAALLGWLGALMSVLRHLRAIEPR